MGRVSRSVPSPTVSIVIPVHNQWAYTIRCLVAVLDHRRDVACEVIVVDNGSTDETGAGLPQLQGIRLHRNPTNLGFSRACNQGAALAQGELVVFLNNDTEPRRGWLSALVAAMRAQPAAAIAGSRLLFGDDTLQSAGLLLAHGFPYPVSVIPRGYRKPAADAPPTGAVHAVTGACMLVRAAAFHAAGGFDEGFENGYEDVDLCLRVAEQGGGTLFVAESLVTHHEAASGGRFKNEAANLDRLQQRWMGRLPPDWLDLDYRRQAAQAPVRPGRPGASVVVVAQDAIATIAPCLENLIATLGPDDEVLIVDDGSRGASAQFLALWPRAHAGRARLVVSEAALGFAGAARLGVGAARRDFVALLAPNVRVAAGWLDKLIASLERDPALGVVSPGSAGRNAADGTPLYAPPASYAPPGASVLDKLVTAGPRPARVPSSGCLVASRALMTELAAVPDLLFGAAPAALADHLARAGKKLSTANDVFVRRFNQVGGDHHGPDRARYLERQSAPPPAGLVSVVILVRDNLALTRACIDSIYLHTPGAFELVLVDNGSSEDVEGMARELAAAGRQVVYVRNAQNEGFAYGCNQGIAASHGAYLVLLNNDVVVTPGWLQRQLALLEMDPAIAVVGPTTNATSGAQLVGTATYRGAAEADRFARQWALEHAGELAIVPRIVGLCMVMRRSLIDEIGGFDTAFGFGNCEDDDLCVRIMRAGHQIAIAYDVFIHHHGSATFRSLDLDARALVDENWRIFCQKWRHPPAIHGPEALAALGRAAPFDRATDRIPVDYREIFHPAAEPLPLATSRPTRVLCIPDFRGAGATARLQPREAVGAAPGRAAAPAEPWRAPLARFLTTFTADDPVALVVRVEPPTPEGAVQAAEAIRGLLRDLALPPGRAPEIIVESTPLPAARRGSLYTAAAAFLSCGGARDRFYRREARACGLPLAEQEPAADPPPSAPPSPSPVPSDPPSASASASASASPSPSPSPPPPPPPPTSFRPSPVVSVIVPTLDRARLLEVALRSALDQTFQDFEIIVVNDAGASVAPVIARLGGAGKIRYIENASRRGHGGARNVGLRAARGRYVTYLDDDDVLHPDHLETLVGALADGRHQVAYTDAQRAKVDATGAVVARDRPYSSDFDPDAMLLTNFIPILCLMHDRACIEAIGDSQGALFDENLPVLEDWDAWIRLSRRYRFVHVPRVTCTFTVRTGGSSVTTDCLHLFEPTERVLRRRYRREIARAPRALHALYQSLVPAHRALVVAGRATQAAAELAAFVASYPESAEARRDLTALTGGGGGHPGVT
jgi:GT2 family glycosyltransferase